MSDIQSYQQKADLIANEPEIRFAGFLDMMGNLVAGSFRSGLVPLKNEEERKKMFKKLFFPFLCVFLLILLMSIMVFADLEVMGPDAVVATVALFDVG